MTDPGNNVQRAQAEKCADQILNFPSQYREWREVEWTEPDREKVVAWFRTELQAAYDAGARDENEACAKRIETLGSRFDRHDCAEIAKAIRARKEKR